jgi:hypothetical protein
MKRTTTYLYTLLFAALALTGCVKDEPFVTTPPTTGITVINAVSDTVINFYYNGVRQSALTGIFPLQASALTSIPRGSQMLTFKQLYNNQSLNSVDTLFTLPVQIDSLGNNQRLNIYVGGINRSTAFKVIDTIVTDAQNARLKLVVASPRVTALRVFVGGNLEFTTSAFKTVRPYKNVGTGNKLIQIFPATGNTPIYSSTVALTGGRAYTLFTSGAGNSFRAGLITNQ